MMPRFLRQVAKATLLVCLRTLKAKGLAEDTVSEAFQFWYDLPVPPTHYYSPLPNLRKAKENLARWWKENPTISSKMDLESQASFIEQLQPFSHECANLSSFAKVSAEGYGQGYGEVESHFLHCVIRYLKPQLILEVGSGVSTFFSLNALQMNARASRQLPAKLHCIEPYPSKKLETLAKDGQIILDSKEVQDSPMDLFECLRENDILFIDSSHTGKVDSDVNFLYLNVLPALKPGVVVHIHDICFPYLTPPPSHPLFDHYMLWNETALCQAFLSLNEHFEVLACQSYLHYKQPQLLGRLLTCYDSKHFPNSLWLRKV